jgi:hypothetical protein
MNEVMEILKKSGCIEKFRKSNEHAIEGVREKRKIKNWEPDKGSVKFAAALVLTAELAKNEELLEKFDEFGTGLAMEAIVEELYKIVVEGK